MDKRYLKIKAEYDQVIADLSQPDVASDQNRYRTLNQRQSELTPIIELIDEYAKLETQLKELNEAIEADEDAELVEMARQECNPLEKRIEKLEEKLKKAILPRDPRDAKDAVLEIRGGAGGDEAALFAAELFRMYARFAEQQGWTFNTMSKNETDLGGLKEGVAEIQGTNVYGHLKFESGVHRVQRIPETEKSGRVHTSTATVAILPLVEDVEFEINPDDLKIDVYRASGAGGQHVNKTESAVRITHIPTGTVVAMQDEKSQHKNKAKAMKILKARVADEKQRQDQAKLSSERRAQVGTGGREEKIRTYNIPQDRITDHRIKYTTHGVEAALAGDLTGIIAKLKEEEERQLLDQES
ncbi:peptide chain release factor 1 [Patescibacteria group bacterium]